MQSDTQIKTRSTLLTLAGLALAGVLSACGGGSAGNDPKGDNNTPVTPPTSNTYFERIVVDTKVFIGTSYGQWGGVGVKIDSNANITFAHHDSSSLLDNYNFTFPSGLAGGLASGNLFTFKDGAADKEVIILAPTATKTVQNVFWHNISNPSSFGFGLAGYMAHVGEERLPKNGTIKFSGKAFQYIVDFNQRIPDQTTYTLYVSDVTAIADYSTSTFTISVAPNPTLINTIGDPAVINVDPAQFASSYTLTDLEGSGFNRNTIWNNMPQSGLGLTADAGMLSHFGSNAEELAGFVKYSGDVTTPAGKMTRNQYISFALTKQ